MDPRMLNLVLSSVAAHFISRPRQARVRLLGVSEKVGMLQRVSGGSDESCCAHWLLVFWAPIVEKDNEGRRWRITLRVIFPQGNLQQWVPCPMVSADTIPCNLSMRSLAHKAKAIPRPFVVLRVTPGDHDRPHRTLPALHSGLKLQPGDLIQGKVKGEGKEKLVHVPWKMLPGSFTFYLNHWQLWWGTQSCIYLKILKVYSLMGVNI